MKRKCTICKQEVTDNQHLPFGRGVAHLDCYTPDKQKDYDSFVSGISYGERSPYWDWVERVGKRNTDGEYEELPEANPDVLAEAEGYAERREYYAELIDNTVQSLSPQETRVFQGLKNGFTEEEVAKHLRISRSMVKLCRTRIRKKFKEHDTKLSV